jgi:hypothetical protein
MRRKIVVVAIALLGVGSIVWVADVNEPATVQTTRAGTERTVSASPTQTVKDTATNTAPTTTAATTSTTTTTTTTSLPQAPSQEQESGEPGNPEQSTVTLPPQGASLDLSQETEFDDVRPGDPEQDPDGAGADVGGYEEGEIYIWYDGDEERTVRLVPNFTDEASGDLPPAVYGSEGAAATGGGVGAVSFTFVDEGTNETKGWEGGIIVIFDPGLDAAQIGRLFSEQGIAESRVTPMLADNAFVVATAPGPQGLNLAATLAQLDGVLVANPNWEYEITTQ